MRAATSSTMTLQNRATMRRSAERVALWITGVAIVLMMVIGAAILFVMALKRGEPIDWSALFVKLSAKFLKDWVELLLAALGIGAAVVKIFYIAISRRWERLVLNELGISYVSPLPAALRFLHPSWSLQWSQIQRAEFSTNSYMRRPEFVTLVLRTGLGDRSLRPYLWVDPSTFQPTSWKKELRLAPPKSAEIAAEVMGSPVMQFIQALPYFKLAPLDLEKINTFALEKNPAALGFVGLFFAAIAYAFVDALLVNAETYVARPYYPLYVAGGLTICLAGVWLMRKANVPTREAVAVAILAGGAFGTALYPGLLRINELTDTEGLQRYHYKMVEPAYFTSEQEGLPEIEFPERHREFWSQYSVGAVERFELRKGGLGFYQIHMRPIYDRIENYYVSKSR